MNKFIVVCFLCLSWSTSGVAKTFYGSSSWNTSSDNFGELSVLGIQFDAVNKALQECKAQGLKACIHSMSYLNAAYNKDGRRNGDASAVVIGFDDILEDLCIDLGFGQIFSSSQTWSFGSTQAGDLKKLGVRGDALFSAIKSCYQANFEVCALQDSFVSADNVWRNNRYEVTAVGQVVGFDISRSRCRGDRRRP